MLRIHFCVLAAALLLVAGCGDDSGTDGGLDTGVGDGGGTDSGGIDSGGTDGGGTDAAGDDGGGTDAAGDDAAMADAGGDSGGGADACMPVAADLTAVGNDCTTDGDCPDGYTCQPFSGVVLTMSCQILCADTCECPEGSMCMEHSDKGGTWKQCDPTG